MSRIKTTHTVGPPRSRTASQTNRGDNEEDTETKEESDKAALVEVVQ